MRILFLIATLGLLIAPLVKADDQAGSYDGSDQTSSDPTQDPGTEPQPAPQAPDSQSSKQTPSDPPAKGDPIQDLMDKVRCILSGSAPGGVDCLVGATCNSNQGNGALPVFIDPKNRAVTISTQQIPSQDFPYLPTWYNYQGFAVIC